MADAPPPPAEIVLAVDGLRKSWGELRAVDDVTFTVGRGEVLALLGPNGAGKTTLMRLICGLLRPDAGRITLAPWPDRSLPQVVGYCPQPLILWPDLTCAEQLVFVGRMHGLSGARCHARADALLARFALTDRAHTLAGQLSGGLQRRLSLALALVHDPPVLILDEPEAGLDPQSRLQLRDIVRTLAHTDGKALLLSTHDMAEAELLADRVAIMDRGRLLTIDTPERLRADAPGDEAARHLEDVFMAWTGRGLRA